MDKILRELNLGTLVDRFDAEKIEPHNVISASGSELTRLGVSIIGDRIRLRMKYVPNIYILLDVLLCSIAEYFYELCRILTSP